MASTLAGNLPITGSVANLIVVESAKPDVEVSFWDYFRAGVPITALTLTHRHRLAELDPVAGQLFSGADGS